MLKKVRDLTIYQVVELLLMDLSPTKGAREEA